MRAVVISVDFGDLLGLTLPLNARHFDQVIVGTASHDLETQRVCAAIPNVVCHVTDDFYKDGAHFNKGIVCEQLFDRLGRWRDEFLVVFDADIIMPDNTADRIAGLQGGILHSPRRRILADPTQWHPDLNWRTCPIKNDEECAGYFQLFHSRDPVLRELPWYGTDWLHAGGCDSDLAARWSQRRRIKLPWYVLHLGVDGQNWCGRATKRLDGTIPPEAKERASKLWWILQKRAESGGRHEHEKLGGGAGGIGGMGQ